MISRGGGGSEIRFTWTKRRGRARHARPCEAMILLFCNPSMIGASRFEWGLKLQSHRADTQPSPIGAGAAGVPDGYINIIASADGTAALSVAVNRSANILLPLTSVVPKALLVNSLLFPVWRSILLSRFQLPSPVILFMAVRKTI